MTELPKPQDLQKIAEYIADTFAVPAYRNACAAYVVERLMDERKTCSRMVLDETKALAIKIRYRGDA